MNKQKGIETVIRGQETEKLVQKKLWKYGYNVERMPAGHHKQPFDLLVNKKFRVDVKSHILKPNRKTWTFYLNRGIEKGKVDVYALVFLYPDGLSQVRYITTETLLKTKFIKKYAISFGTEDELLEKSPLKIFGKVGNKKLNNKKL